MPQEFLASFAVDIDEGGVNRLERILENNRELAKKLADAFDEARAAMEGFIRPLTEDPEGILPFLRPEAAGGAAGAGGTFPVGLDFAQAGKQLETFIAGAKKQLRLSADGSGIVSAVSAAISRARSMLAGAGLTLPVRVETYGAGIPGAPAPAAYAPGTAGTGTPAGGNAVFPAESAALLAGIPGMLSGAADAAAPRVTQNTTTRNVSAPVNIRVEAVSADPEAVGRSVYNTAEQHLLRTLQEA
jgi:hypothetical protein